MANREFMTLPEAKRRRIIDAGFKVFGLNEYKKASTEDIAREAGISKGYLFYYFRNKKTLYLFLYDKALEISRRQVLDKKFDEISDFFEMMSYAARRKAQLAVDFPYLTDFILRAFFSQREEVSAELQKKILADIDDSYKIAFKNLDLSPFKEEVDPTYLMRLLHWMGDGYLHEAQRQGLSPAVEDIMKETDRMLALMRKLCYKKERQ